MAMKSCLPLHIVTKLNKIAQRVCTLPDSDLLAYIEREGKAPRKTVIEPLIREAQKRNLSFVIPAPKKRTRKVNPMNGYVCFYNSQRWECRAYSQAEATEKAIVHFKVNKRNRHMVSVVLAEKDGKQVIHTPFF